MHIINSMLSGLHCRANKWLNRKYTKSTNRIVKLKDWTELPAWNISYLPNIVRGHITNTYGWSDHYIFEKTTHVRSQCLPQVHQVFIIQLRENKNMFGKLKKCRLKIEIFPLTVKDHTAILQPRWLNIAILFFLCCLIMLVLKIKICLVS